MLCHVAHKLRSRLCSHNMPRFLKSVVVWKKKHTYCKMFLLKANSVLCVKCGKWIHSRYVMVKKVTEKVSRNFLCTKCEGNIGDVVGQKEKLCDEVESVREVTYLGDRVSVGGKYAAAVIIRTRCG